MAGAIYKTAAAGEVTPVEVRPLENRMRPGHTTIEQDDPHPRAVFIL
jgi:hypothetical protein